MYAIMKYSFTPCTTITTDTNTILTLILTGNRCSNKKLLTFYLPNSNPKLFCQIWIWILLFVKFEFEFHFLSNLNLNFAFFSLGLCTVLYLADVLKTLVISSMHHVQYVICFLSYIDSCEESNYDVPVHWLVIFHEFVVRLLRGLRFFLQ